MPESIHAYRSDLLTEPQIREQLAGQSDNPALRAALHLLCRQYGELIEAAGQASEGGDRDAGAWRLAQARGVETAFSRISEYMTEPEFDDTQDD